MLDVLDSAAGRARGVATVEPDVSRRELEEMHERGVRGVRFNYVRRLVDPEPDAYYHRIVEKIAPLGWHVVVYFEAADLAERWDLFTSLDTPVVVDHLGRPDVTKSVDGPEFAQFLRLMRERENVWCKVTCPERLSVSGPPDFTDTVPFARRVVDEFPDRVLWGTDWPHPNLKGFMPDDGKIVDFIPRIAPTREELQAKLLVDNPARLYWEQNA
jgi:2-pyrone-4,6-dicarboxylate lactonase